MFINTVPSTDGSRALLSLADGVPIELAAPRNRIKSGAQVVFSSRDPEELTARYNDICAAIVDGGVTVYDCTKRVGYWKKSAAAAAKKEAPSGN